MKNIYTLPTDKPSKLFTNMNDELSLLGRYSEYKGFISNQNIYITSDEKIKRGDCILLPNNEIIVLPTGLSQVPLNNFIRGYSLSDCKKIILTTDPDLTKDGVQAIDDDFLEWFVKNPSCEEVEVFSQNVYSMGKWNTRHKIIIPKEEPTLANMKCICMRFEANCFSGMCRNCGFPPKEEPKQTDWKDSTKALMQSYGDNPKDFPYEETLEEDLDCPFDFTSRCTMGRCDCKPKKPTLEESSAYTKGFKDGLK